MKITLNTASIQEARRPQIEALVRTFTKDPEIVWLPSRFPHFVMFVEPGPNDSAEPANSSIFESPQEEIHSPSALTGVLEERIKRCLTLPG